MDNITIADCLRQYARELDAEGGNLMRVRAYRRAAQMIDELDEPLATVLERGGRRGLQCLPTIGPRIARAIESLIRTGKVPPRRTVAAGVISPR